jgi:maleylacetate reductase
MSDAENGLDRFTVTLRGPRVVYGEGVAETELAAELDKLAANRILVLGSARELRARADMLKRITDRIVGVFPDVRRHVPVATARAAISDARAGQADCLLSIGGGSAVGTAKAVALETGLPILSVPTTYAGSDFTPIYGITDESGKHTGRSDRVLPRTVLLDPTLTWDLPLDITRVSAVNALAHCVSGAFAAGRNPVSDLLAVDGVRLIARGLRGVCAPSGGTAARSDLARGAHLAGTVLAHAGGSAHHAICHLLGGAFDLPHAETHTSVLPASSAFLQEHKPRAAERLASALDSNDLATGIAELLAETGASVRLRTIGLSASDVPWATDLLSGGGPVPGVPGMDFKQASALLAAVW